MQKTKEIFNRVGIAYDESQVVRLEKVEVNVLEKSWHVFLHTSTLISEGYFSEIETKLSQYYKNDVSIFLILDLELSNLNEQSPSILQGHYQRMLKSDAKLKQAAKSINVLINQNTIIFQIASNFETQRTETLVKYLIPHLKQLGITNYGFDTQVIGNEKKREVAERIEEEIKKNEVKVVKKPERNIKVFGEDLIDKKSQTISQVLDPNMLLVNCTIEGVIFDMEIRELKKTSLLTLMVFDGTATMTLKAFPGFNNQPPRIDDFKQLKVGMRIKARGKKEFDRYANDETLMLQSVTILEKSVPFTDRIDTAENKRVELHTHSKMSRNNGISNFMDYAKMASHFGHKAIAITDHNVVQGFVEAERAAKAFDLKVIYGMEATVVGTTKIAFNPTEQLLEEVEYVVFDVETTGLSANFNKLIEIGAVKVRGGQIVDRYQCFIKIDEQLSEFTTSLTGITDEDLLGGLELSEALREFYEWSKDGVLVAHNAIFDYQFLARNYERELGLTVTQPVIDTLELSRYLHPENMYHSLKIITKRYKVPMDSNSHHRADYDAEKLTEVFVQMITKLKDLEVNTINELNTKNNINKTRGKHNLIYVKNMDGLRDIYYLVSEASTTDFQQEPRILKDNLAKLRKNLIYVGGGCAKSEIIDSYLNHSQHELENVIKQFDYVELLPLSQYQSLINEDTFKSRDEIITMLHKIYEIATANNIKVLANGNVHYLEPDQKMMKEVLYAKDFKADKVKKNADGVEEFIDKIKFNKWCEENEIKNSNQFFRSTDEMMDEFSHFSEEITNEIVIENPNLLAESTDILKIIPDELFTPNIDGVEEKLENMVYDKAKSIYGEDLPEIVTKRIEKELKSIIGYGFSVIYYISHKLVKHSLDHDYLVGSRGSVGSSLVATFMDITEINPLVPHYVCPKCKESHFIEDGSVGSGYDLPLKSCEKCDVEMIRDGQDIPFETFLGFEGDKVPDIDLNFSGEFQAEAHNYVRAKEDLDDAELFDFNHAFRAGTIGTIATKTAYAYVRNYFELIDRPIRNTDINYYLKDLEGIKRTTGQHPGGIIVVPAHHEIYEFTAIQYPADDKKQPWRTTHFDFHSIHDNLLKLDILGHDDPTMLKKLKDLTQVDPKYVNITDEKVMELFTSTNSLGVSADDILTELGTMGVPEFGTKFVMEMLKDTKPSTFAELVQISGLSHGTDVWLGNAKDLIDQGICELKDVIGCRDDIMVYLMYQGLDAAVAFNIMEKVRKGKGVTEEEIKIMRENKVPEWYIDSCQKIKYMFPKAHAAAYVLMALRIAYYKVYYPIHYYAAYFSSRVDDFDAHSMLGGSEVLQKRIEHIESNIEEMSEVKRKSLLNSLKMSLEMCKRGMNFAKFDLNRSEANEFVISDDQQSLILPFSTLDGLGEKEAIRIIEERNQKEFTTIEDFKKRTRVKKKSFEQLEFYDVFTELEDSNQIMFDL